MRRRTQALVSTSAATVFFDAWQRRFFEKAPEVSAGVERWHDIRSIECICKHVNEVFGGCVEAP